MRAFALAPGFVATQLAAESEAGPAPDTVALPASTMLYLTSGRADSLSGRSAFLLLTKDKMFTVGQILFCELGYRGGGACLEGRDCPERRTG